AFAAADREADEKSARRVMGRAVPAGEPMHLFHQARMDGIIVVEHHPKEELAPLSGLSLTDSRKYGQTCIAFLCPAGYEDPAS
ncbi:MAG TPA: hypothetical protein PLZ86_09950, partial [bacterium]|nr:hypothetical protein [bacterium]